MVKSQLSSSLLTVHDVTAKLKISRTLLHRLRKDGKLTAVIIGDSVRFTEQEIERFIRESSQSAA
jgi:excisionase family DNA binding protein